MSSAALSVERGIKSQISGFRYVPRHAYTLQTHDGPVSVICTRRPDFDAVEGTDVEQAMALARALAESDDDNVVRNVLNEIIPKYPAHIQLALLRLYAHVLKPGLSDLEAHPPRLVVEAAQRRMSVHAQAGLRMRQYDKALHAANCDVAFDDGELCARADWCEKLCAEFSRAVSCNPPLDELIFNSTVRELSSRAPEDFGWLTCLRHGDYVTQPFISVAHIVQGMKVRASHSLSNNATMLAKMYGLCASLAHLLGLLPPLPGKGGVTVLSAVARMRDARWWRRQMRRYYSRKAECLMRELGYVSAHRGLYVSEQTYDRCRQQRRRVDLYMAAMLAVNELGESVSLEDLFKHSVSNPAIRRVELIVRMKGGEEYAKEHGHSVQVCHVTLPGTYHCVYKQSGEFVEHFNGRTPREGQALLQATWEKSRTALARAGIKVYGFRIAEPCHDGTVHWHMMLCMPPNHVQLFREVMERYFRDQLEPDEAGAKEHRVKFVDLDPTRGNAVSYMVKYLSKGLDGEGVGEDKADSIQHRDAKDTAQRATDHARTHGIRRFQPIGLPSIAIWREVRRIKQSPGGSLAALWEAIEEKDFGKYIKAMGGPCLPASKRPVSLHYEKNKELSQYGEVKQLRLRGIKCGNVIVVTRELRWQMVRRPQSSPTWTCGNNCTGSSSLIRMVPTNGSILREPAAALGTFI